MSELTSDEVPQKFTEWLLAMGCHPEIVPPIDKVAEKCRGQYYMVWRSLMEKVEAKHIIKNKRPQVFCDDIRKCQKKNVLNERDANTVVPEELLLWQRHTHLKAKVADAEARVSKEKENLHQLTEKANSKLCQRYLLSKRLQDSQRSALLLQRLADKLTDERANLVETRTIAESLCGLTDDTDVESTLDKCIASLTRPLVAGKTGAPLPAGNTGASSTIASTSSENDDEVLSSLSRCRGELLFKQLLERRAGLCAAVPGKRPGTTANTKRVRSVVSHSAGLHCSLALEAGRSRIRADTSRNQLAKIFLQLDNYLSSEACELLVTRCELACIKARVTSLRSSVEDLAKKGGIFAVEGPQNETAGSKTIYSVDKAIESKRDELERLIASVAAVEKKTQNVREHLLSRFNSFHDDAVERDRFGGPTSHPQETISSLRRFHEGKREKYNNKPNLSMNLDMSDNCSFNDLPDKGNSTFSDELKLYLNKFNLEKNRKIVLKSGEKIWIFESTTASLHDLHTTWHSEDITTSLLSPYVTLKQNLHRLAEDTARKRELEALLRGLERDRRRGSEIDISQSKYEEQKILDRVKKRLNDNLLSLKKTRKTLDIGLENLQFWADNNMRVYISDKRMVDGKRYLQYEKAYFNS